MTGFLGWGEADIVVNDGSEDDPKRLSEPSINALFQKVREMIREVNSTVSKATRTLTPTPGSGTTATVTSFTPSMSVPKLKVPTFSGKTTEWTYTRRLQNVVMCTTHEEVRDVPVKS